MFGFLRQLRENRNEFRGKNVLFIHTGGMLGLYDKIEELREILNRNDPRVQSLL